MKHRQLRNRIARIERRRVAAAYDPYDPRQGLMRVLEGQLPPEEAANVVDWILSVPRAEAYAWLQAQIDARKT